jgi:hypothetical protein
MERRVWGEVARFEEGRHVSFVTFAERHGLEKGLEKGREEGLLRGIEACLRLRFGQADAALLEALAGADAALLGRVLAAVETAGSPDDLRRLLPASNGTTGAAP